MPGNTRINPDRPKPIERSSGSTKSERGSKKGSRSESARKGWQKRKANKRGKRGGDTSGRK